MKMVNQQKIKIYEEGKIDIHNRKEYFQKALEKLKVDNEIILENKKLILEFIHDCILGKTIKGRSKKKIGPARCLKYISILRQLSLAFGKSFDQISQKNMENLIGNLEADIMVKKSGDPFSEATKVDIKKAIKKFWKWKDGNNKVYPDLVEWIDTYISVKDVPALRREEIEKMIDFTSNPRNKALLMVLFDSGARIEELLNVRLKDEHISWKEDLGCYSIRLEFSKTKPRTISIPLSTKHLRNWLEVHPFRNDNQAQLFPLSYANLRMIISRIGRRVLNKRVNPHMFRHSSATYYANKLKNHYKLCYRYGWAMASDMVNRYLDREGLFEEETADLIRSDEISKADKKSSVLQEELSLVRESYSELSERFTELRNELDDFQNGKGYISIMMKLIKRQEEMSQVLSQVCGKKFDVIFPVENNSKVL